MKTLIVNSDDYGRSTNVSKGIREAHLNGVVSSTTCMMNMPTTADDIRIALKETPNLGLGVHLVLTAGYPLLPASEVPSLVREGGKLPRLPEFVEKLDQLNPQEAKAEWTAQIEAFVKAAGRPPTHLDSHHHSSYYTVDLFTAMLELAKAYGCALRLTRAVGSFESWAGLPQKTLNEIRDQAPKLLKSFNTPVPDGFFASFYDELATREEMIRILSEVPEDGVYEVMCHPGYSDPELNASSGYARQRDVELEVLTSAEVLSAVKEFNIQLINFSALTKNS